MLGTFVNTAAIFIGSLTGSLINKNLPEKYQQVLYDAMGLAATGIGIEAIVKNLPQSNYPVLFIASLAIGGLFGTFFGLEEKFHRLAARYASNNLGQGLSTAMMLFCIGTLSILGPIESALHQNYTYLFTNAALDLVTSMVLAAAYGIGIALAAPVLFLWQGSIFLIACYSAQFLTSELLTEISAIGGFLILASGLSILKIKTFQTINLLPALCIPIVWFLLLPLL